MPTSKRHTVQKSMTYQAICELANHPTAEEIYAKVKSVYPSISLGTVYRNLSSLCEEGLVYHIMLSGEADRYDHNVFDHSHVICSSCGSVCDVLLPYFDTADKDTEVQTGFTGVTHTTVFHGTCKKCQNNSCKTIQTNNKKEGI